MAALRIRSSGSISRTRNAETRPRDCLKRCLGMGSFEGGKKLGGPRDSGHSTYLPRRFSGLRCGSVQNSGRAVRPSYGLDAAACLSPVPVVVTLRVVMTRCRNAVLAANRRGVIRTCPGTVCRTALACLGRRSHVRISGGTEWAASSLHAPQPGWGSLTCRERLPPS
jgi:hypothetical protein